MKIYRHCERSEAIQSHKKKTGLPRRPFGLLAMTVIAALALTGCISREQADMRLQRGCTAGAELFLGDGYKITEVKDHIFRDSPDLGAGYREARLTVSVNDGFADTDREIRCIFSETYNNFSHTASIYQLKMDDKTWGKEGDEILGTMDEHMKLNETVDKALMNQ